MLNMFNVPGLHWGVRCISSAYTTASSLWLLNARAITALHTYDLSISLFLNSQKFVDSRPNSSSVPSKPLKTKNDPRACFIMFSRSWISEMCENKSNHCFLICFYKRMYVFYVTFLRILPFRGFLSLTVFDTNLWWKKFLEGGEDSTVGDDHGRVNLQLLLTFPHLHACHVAQKLSGHQVQFPGWHLFDL